MTRIKKLNIFIIAAVILMSATFCAPLVANAETNANDIIENIDIGSSIINTGEQEQEFKSAIEAISFAQNKLAKRLNYESSVSTVMAVNPNMAGLNLKAGFESKTTIDSNGNGYSLDVCNVYYSWLNGQYGLESYFQKNGNNVKYRQTTDVTTDTGIATFSDEYTIISRSEADAEFGYIDNSNLVIITRDNVKQVTCFKKFDKYYQVAVKLTFGTAKEIKQKLYKCAGLEKLPSVRNFEVTMFIDNYGNIISAVYDISCKALKRIDYDQLCIHATLDVDLNAVIKHSYNYNAGKTIVIPE